VRRITVALLSTVSGLVLLFSYHTSRGPDTDLVGLASAGTDDTADTGSSGSASGTFTGDVADTRWGPVQVRIVVRDGRITDAEAIRYPDGNHRDLEINSWAIPQLQQATVRANSAEIDSLSGATVTSQGYLTSLQSALDQARR
jgi:uncharacterized protein with FMN-binding domain